MEKFKLYYYIGDEITSDIFNSFDDMNEFIINYEVEVFDYKVIY